MLPARSRYGRGLFVCRPCWQQGCVWHRKLALIQRPLHGSKRRHINAYRGRTEIRPAEARGDRAVNRHLMPVPNKGQARARQALSMSPSHSMMQQPRPAFLRALDAVTRFRFAPLRLFFFCWSASAFKCLPRHCRFARFGVGSWSRPCARKWRRTLVRTRSSDRRSGTAQNKNRNPPRRRSHHARLQ